MKGSDQRSPGFLAESYIDSDEVDKLTPRQRRRVRSRKTSGKGVSEKDINFNRRNRNRSHLGLPLLKRYTKPKTKKGKRKR